MGGGRRWGRLVGGGEEVGAAGLVLLLAPGELRARLVIN